MSSLLKRPSKSATAPKLPVELWLLIFESVVGLSIDPAGYCNHLNFPYISRHLRFPSEYPSVISPSIRDLRLVCRYFNSLLGPSPSLLMRDPGTVIPPTTMALHILPQESPQACLERLLADPPTSSRIVILNLLGYEHSARSPAANFDFLYENAHSLPAVRSLAMCVRIQGIPAVISNFWGRLNDAFPSLTCLVLRGYLDTSDPDATVEFKSLAVLDWNRPNSLPLLQFPRLRHLAFGTLRRFRPEMFAGWPQLESLVLRSLQRGESLDWALFPQLRLLGLPAQRIDAFPPLPPNHPLQHLYIFIGTRPRDDHNRHLFDYDLQLTWFKNTIYQMPTVTRISFWFDKRGPNQHRWITGYFREDDLELLGFGDVIFPDRHPQDGSHRVLQRLTPGPQTKVIMTQDPAPRRIGFRTIWSMFTRFIPQRMRL